jgi:hypothetical protein
MVLRDGESAGQVGAVLRASCKDLARIQLPALLAFARRLNIPLSPAHSKGASKGAVCEQIVAALDRMAAASTKPGVLRRLGSWVAGHWKTLAGLGATGLTSACQTDAFRGSAICSFWNQAGSGLYRVLTTPASDFYAHREQMAQRSYERELGLTKASTEKLLAEYPVLEAQIRLAQQCAQRKQAHLEEIRLKLANPSWLECAQNTLGVSREALSLFAQSALGYGIGGPLLGSATFLSVDALRSYFASAPDPASDIQKICGALSSLPLNCS